MKLRGKKLSNFIIGFRYLNRMRKNILFNFRKNAKFINTNTDSVIIIKKRYAKLYWLIGDPGLKDRLAYQALVNNGFNPRILIDPTEKELSNIKEKLIWINPHHFMFDKNRAEDGLHSQQIAQFIDKLEQTGKTVIPSSHDILYWENKMHMHQQMKEKDIRHPVSIIINDLTQVKFTELKKELGSPFLIKLPDGYSSKGLYLIHTEQQFQNIGRVKKAIAQEFLNIQTDLRLIMVNGETASFYWRKNPKSKEWKPTATSGGATVEFFNLPVAAEKLGREIYEKFGLATFGADITWRNDDFTSEPYVLEFSPIYQPNPISPGQRSTANYNAFKQKTIFKYDKAFEELVTSIFDLQIRNYRKNEVQKL